MDRVANSLREDARAIDVTVSPDLDARIRASLEGVTPERREARRASQRPTWFWWASSLTGVVAAILVIVVLNLRPPETALPTTVTADPGILSPPISWRVETAVLTSPLEKEMEDLQSDLKKAEDLKLIDKSSFTLFGTFGNCTYPPGISAIECENKI